MAKLPLRWMIYYRKSVEAFNQAEKFGPFARSLTKP